MSSIFGNVVDGLKKLMQALQAIEPAPNDYTVQFDDTILLEKTGVLDQNTTLNSTSITIEDSSGAPEFSTLGTTELFLVNASAQNSSECMLGTFTQNHRCGLEVVSNINSSICSVLAGFEDSTPNYPTIALVNQGDSAALSIQLGSFFISADNLKSYAFEFAHKFIKWNTGSSLSVSYNEQYVDRDKGFKVCDDGSGFAFDTYEKYLDQQGDVGWTVILCNPTGADITVTSVDAEFFYHPGGPSGLTFQLKKFATARFTLIKTNAIGTTYAWASSMY